MTIIVTYTSVTEARRVAHKKLQTVVIGKSVFHSFREDGEAHELIAGLWKDMSHVSTITILN